jgi:hypothetical protein
MQVSLLRKNYSNIRISIGRLLPQSFAPNVSALNSIRNSLALGYLLLNAWFKFANGYTEFKGGKWVQ